MVRRERAADAAKNVERRRVNSLERRDARLQMPSRQRALEAANDRASRVLSFGGVSVDSALRNAVVAVVAVATRAPTVAAGNARRGGESRRATTFDVSLVVGRCVSRGHARHVSLVTRFGGVPALALAAVHHRARAVLRVRARAPAALRRGGRRAAARSPRIVAPPFVFRRVLIAAVRRLVLGAAHAPGVGHSPRSDVARARGGFTTPQRASRTLPSRPPGRPGVERRRRHAPPMHEKRRRHACRLPRPPRGATPRVRGKAEPFPSRRRGCAPSRERPRRDRARCAAHRRVRMCCVGTPGTSYRKERPLLQTAGGE